MVHHPPARQGRGGVRRHDDCVMALAIAVVVVARMPRPLPPAESQPAPRVGHLRQTEHARTNGPGPDCDSFSDETW